MATIKKSRFLLFCLLCLAILCVFVLYDSETLFKDIPYVENGTDRQKLDIYLPRGYRDGPALPVLVWIHGGGFRTGSKSPMPGRDFLKLGYAMVSIDYRLTSEAIFPAQAEDCKAAIRWLRANATTYNFDTDHIGVLGNSAGGVLAAFLGTTGETKEFDVGENLNQSSKVQAVCDFCGSHDLTAPENELLMNNITLYLGGPPRERKELAVKASPITYAAMTNAPFLIVHGDEDKSVPLDQSIRFHKALLEAGAKSELFIRKGVGHTGYDGNDMELKQNVSDFFNKHLKPKKM